MQRIRTNSEAGRRLFFVEGASDVELNLAYQSANALIAASVAEGFGLPIVEAAMHGKPTIASDIPVFREVGGKDTMYFSLEHPRMLADAIMSFCDLPDVERRAMAARIKVTTWKESASRLLEIISGSDPYATVRPTSDGR
jgi:glycosyltransferase involved in cell wall biosynthesis